MNKYVVSWICRAFVTYILQVCEFSTCSIDTNGSTMKRAMLNDRVIKALHKWYQKVKNN